MGSLAKIKNLTNVGGVITKHVAFIINSDKSVKLSPTLFGVFTGDGWNRGTWQSLRKDNVIISKVMNENSQFRLFRATDNSSNVIMIDNCVIMSSIDRYLKDHIEISNFFDIKNDDPFIDRQEDKWISNINKRKKLKNFSEVYGIDVPDEFFTTSKNKISLHPESSLSYKPKTDDKIYQSNGKGVSFEVKSTNEVPPGTFFVIKNDESISVFIKMDNSKVE